MTSPAHILVVDDDRRLRTLLRKYLTDQRHAVTEAASAAEARQLLTLFRFDLMILDVMMPGESGLELARNLPTRRFDPPPVLMLTARDAPEDRIAGLETGIEDYLAKPFEPRELLLRIGNILKRRRSDQASQAAQFGPFRFDAATGKLTRDGEPVYLTTAEATLLALLAGRIGQPFSREEIAARIGEPEDSSRKIDVQIGRLRKKIEPDTARPRYIQTVRGAGYRLNP